jgi:cystathionine beta-lyase
MEKLDKEKNERTVKIRKRDTVCVHAGEQTEKFKSINTPVYTSTAFGYLDTEERLYPRYFNTPNQQVLIEKLSMLEGSESGLVFSLGMAAISTVIFGLFGKGDHIVFQKGLYGGTLNFILRDLKRFGIEYTILENNCLESFLKAIHTHTKAIFVETPTNPLLSIVDLAAISEICRKKHLVSIIDNTFASPVNQNPIKFGMDVVIHSATKYLGGHSDITAGVVLSTKQQIEKIEKTALNLGGSLDSLVCYLLERSIKTLTIRVEKQNANAQKIAEFLSGHSCVSKVFYPGLPSHEGYETARKQMSGYGGMVSFEAKGQDAGTFMRKLLLVKPALSLGGVESTICDPSTTSHRHLTKEQKVKDGISDNLLRLSVGIEDVNDLISDLNDALTVAVKIETDT